MGGVWSTREIAELAGTSLRAVRHYHEVGLLDEPERRANGYKQYGVEHLVRLMRIKRFTDLGFTLSQIAAMGDVEDHPMEAMRALDDELAATIERLQRARAELGLILRRAVPAGLPAEFAGAADPEMSEADRSFIVVLSRVLGPQSLQTYIKLVRETPADPLGKEFDALPADADEATRQSLAERLAPYVDGLRSRYPGLIGPVTDAPRGPRFVQETIGKALVALYHPAQIDVMRRIEALLNATP